MATKLQMYSALAERQAEQVTKGRENWTNFLAVSARLYKYPFAEQLMIYAQRPDATACAPIEMWNDPLKRWVRRGSKGIALIDDTGNRPRLKYVFDVSDTEPSRANSPKPYLWEMQEEHIGDVIERLAESYENVEGDVYSAILAASKQLADEYWNDNHRDIGYAAEGSFLEDYDEYNLEVAFTSALTNSVAFCAMTRCGIDPYKFFEDEDFQGIFDFNTPSTIYALGTATSDLSEQILRDVELVVKKHERQRIAERRLSAMPTEERSATHERTDIQPEGGLPSSRLSIVREPDDARRTDRQIRDDAPEVSQGASSNIVQFAALERETVSPSPGDRANGDQSDSSADGDAAFEESSPGQINRADAVGRPHEQPSLTSGGDNNQRADIQLSTAETQQSTEPPAPGGSFVRFEQNSTVSLDEFDTILRDGGNQRNSVLRIAAQFMKGKALEDDADFLEREFRVGGKGFQLGGEKVSVWYDQTGITIGRGDTALQNSEKHLVSWAQVANRIRELLDAGQFLPGDELAEAIDNERYELTERLLFFYRDDLRDWREMPEGWRAERGGFPDDKENLKSLLDEPESRKAIIKRVSADIAALQTDPEAPLRFWHSPSRLLADVWDSDIVPIDFPKSDYDAPGFMPFITEDEIDAFFTRNSGGIANSKYNILSVFLNDNTAKERAACIRDRYHNSGASHAVSSADNSGYDAFSAKLRLHKGKEEVNLTWSAAAERVNKLIKSGRYMTQAELDRIPEYERFTVATYITNFYHAMPEDIERPYQSTDRFFSAEDRGIVAEMLLDKEWAGTTLEAMKALIATADPEGRHYDYDVQAVEALRQFHDGEYNLFPGLELMAPRQEQPLIVATPPAEQLSIFDFSTEETDPALPTVEEQMAQIEQQTVAEEVLPENISAHDNPITPDEMDALLLSISDDAVAQIEAQFADNPRSREAVALIRNIYGTVATTLPRTDGEDGYMGILGEDTGVVFSKGAPYGTPDRPESATLSLSWSQLVKRLGELYADGRFERQTLPEVQQNGWSYAVGDSVYLEGKEYRITAISDYDKPAFDELDQRFGSFGREITLIDPALIYPIARSERQGALERMLAHDERNDQYRHYEAVQPVGITEEVVSEPPTVAPEDFDAVAQMVFERVMSDPDYMEDLANAISRAALRNPVTWALEQTIRDHEQDEPAVFHSYFHDSDFNDRLFAHVLTESWEQRPLPEVEATTTLDDSVSEQEEQERAEWLYNERSKIEASNYHITDDHLGEGGAKTKFRNNVAAIETLKRLENYGLSASLTDQETLAKYVGWGGLAQAFDPENPDWAKEYTELRGLLTPDEYESARASTLNAHYTSPTVIKAIYETVERLGFEKGNVLEPACGVGNFFGLLPESMSEAKLYGVELDNVSARIAKKLYPDADIQQKGFEKTDTPDAFFDLAIGNVPFGSYQVSDKRYDKNNFLIHDFFFAKTLDQVRPGGLVAFITSKGTLDKQNPEVRKYIAQRAELLGAVRLPNNAFLKNAGTEVTSDILFLKKRESPTVDEPDWVHLGLTDSGVPVNRYFVDNPEMVLGTMAFDRSMYGNENEATCNPIEGADLAEQLRSTLLNIEGQYETAELDDIDGVDNNAIPADPNVRNYSYTLVDDTVYYRENSQMFPVDLPATTLDRIRGMVGLRDCVHSLINLQLDDWASEATITETQEQLGRLYDEFSADFGLINSSANNRAFAADSAYYLLCSLEILNEDGELDRKADMFSKRTIKQKSIVTSVDTASEALAVSIGERACVDMQFMSTLTEKTEQELFEELRGVIFLDLHFDGNIDHYTYRTADDFLSGNVREKLRTYSDALEALPDDYRHIDAFRDNVAALEKAQPKDLDASEISVRLGSTWVDKLYIQQFMFETLETPIALRRIAEVNFLPLTAEWQVDGKNRVSYNDILANITYGTSRVNAYEILQDTLNLKDVRVYDYVETPDRGEKRVLNKKETTLAQQKQDALKQAFKDWIWKDPERRHELTTVYNERFNSTKPREYDGDHITFSGISPDITLRAHQRNAIAHILYGGNTLLAHEVGAGKTFEMVAAAMESKRLGLCHKSLFAVPNHLTEQWASEFLRLYPSANILVATKKDFEMRNRKKFCAKIATGDYDAVILGHSQLEKIPISQERQERHLQEQIFDITEALDEMKRSRGSNRFAVKQLEKTKKSLETRLTKLLDAKRKDDVVTFEQLGIDRLFVDEAHYYKNLFLYTKMRNVAGLSQSEAQKSSDLFMKCRYLDELTNNKGTIFATGTPISNSMSEMYTMQRYLQYDTLAKNGLTHFDAWASTFGETVTAIELAPEGTGYRARTRFSKFHNLPELMAMFRDVADIKMADQLDLPRPIPHFDTVVVKPTELQEELVQSLSERAAAVHAGNVEPTEDNMLKITSDGRKIGLDQRLIDPLLPDDERSKVNACVQNVFDTWESQQEDRLTQLVFCDFSTPNKDGRFNVYDDIKAKLIERGVPENEVALIHDANTETRKKELFAKVRQGKVRVLIGSTFKMGSGTNVQDRLFMLHDLDCPWRPSDLEQRAGRIVRQGNQNPEVYIRRYVTEATFDAYLYQTVENKQKFISQIMSSKSPVRSCEDVDETALSYAEIKALCAGNPLIKEKMDLDIEVSRLRLLRAEHQSQQHRLEDNLLKNFPASIETVKGKIAGFKKDIATLTAEASGHTDKFSPMTIMDTTYTDKEKAGEALLDACKQVKGREALPIGSYQGFAMSLDFDSFNKEFSLTLKGSISYRTTLGKDVFGNITRMTNLLADIPNKLVAAETQLENLHNQVENAKHEMNKPFAQETELTEKSERLAFLDAELNMDSGRAEPIMMVDEAAKSVDREIAKSKPSIMERMKAFNEKPKTDNKQKDNDLSI